ncbi:MAG: hypothetical protein A3F17_08290 [Gammaproteobacteria bacterium RIFCSPHIGHO2_12_FULL_41_15]|nr:MAG: hypothetical protein A3F17_08290 [Gammaproteobacteria bacterium RIFCSPHIGHO2_12_FULL_41_15]
MKNNLKGFTLFEVLVSLAIAVALLIAIRPAVSQVWQHWQIEQTSNALEQAWQTARVIAVQKNETVTLCGSSDGKHCDGDWQKAWIIQSNQKVWQQFRNPYVATTITLKSNLPTQNYLQFSSLGTTQGQQGRFVVCESERCRDLIFIRSGRLRVA